MLTRTLPRLLLTTSFIWNSKCFVICEIANKSTPSKVGFFSNRNHFTFLRQKPRKTPIVHTKLPYSSLKYQLERQADYKLRKQGILPLELHSKMDEDTASPDLSLYKLPSSIKGMKTLDKSAFETKLKLPCVIVNSVDLHRLMYLLKKFVFKMQKFNSVQDIDEAKVVEKSEELQAQVDAKSRAEGNSNLKIYQVEGYAFKHSPKSKVITLNPALIDKFEDFGAGNLEALAAAKVTAKNFAFCEVGLGYKNFSAEEVLKAILPSMMSSFTSVGHIVQCNLREEHEEYKSIIGQVLLDKVPQCETVVSKTHAIDNTYRNFEMELLAGRRDMITTHRENGVMFQLDFSKVYWNSRLSTEHQRIVGDIHKGDVLLDVFAGIGPFSIPAARKGARVIANDLNPDSVHWLGKTIEVNKRMIQIPIAVHQKDAKDFIRSEVRTQLFQWMEKKRKEMSLGKISPSQMAAMKADAVTPRVKIVMNLPATAVEFVKYLRLLTDEEFDELDAVAPLPILYLYTFLPKIDLETKTPIPQGDSVKALFEAHGLKYDETGMGLNFVRNVSPNKNMFKVKVPLTREFLVKREEVERGEQRREKRDCGVEENIEVKKARVE